MRGLTGVPKSGLGHFPVSFADADKFAYQQELSHCQFFDCEVALDYAGATVFHFTFIFAFVISR